MNGAVPLFHQVFIASAETIFALTFKNRASYIYRTGLQLPSRCCILYIFFSTNISTEYFKHAAHSPFLFFKMPFVS
jgi:hypothetical protein